MRPSGRRLAPSFASAAIEATVILLAFFLGGCSRVQQQVFAVPQTPPLEFLGAWGVAGDAPGQLTDPAGPAVDEFSRVYLVNRPSGLVQKFELAGDPLLSFDADGSRHASAVAVDAGGGIYVANVATGEMRIYFPEGDLLRVFRVPPQPRFDGPYGFSIAADGTVYVPDPAEGRVEALSSQGSLERAWHVAPAAGAKQAKPVIAVVGPDGFIYVGDAQSNRVVKYTREGMQVAAWDDSAGAPAPLLGLAVSSNSVFMLRGASPRIVVWSLDGQKRLSDDLGGRLANSPANAARLAVSPNGELIVLDPGVPRVLRFRIHF